MKITALGLIALSVAAVSNAHEYEEHRHHNDPGVLLPTCTATNITQGKVAGCVCTPGGNTYTHCLNQQYGLVKCDTVCDATNYPAGACDIYYYDVCDCEKLLILGHAGTDCIPSKKWTGQGDPPTWILRRFHANLITSPVLNTGVEHLGSMRDNNGGWILGLDNMDKTTQALAMNSKNSRSRNQIHIHLCHKSHTAANILSNSTPSASFTAIQGTSWVCRGTNGRFVSSDVVNYLRTQSSDFVNRAGIGLLTDTKNRLWECISEGGSAEHIFCSP